MPASRMAREESRSEVLVFREARAPEREVVMFVATVVWGEVTGLIQVDRSIYMRRWRGFVRVEGRSCEGDWLFAGMRWMVSWMVGDATRASVTV